MFSRRIHLILIALILAPIALAEKTPAMDSSPHAVLLGSGLESSLYQNWAALPGRLDSARIGTLTTLEPVDNDAVPLMVADNKKDPPPKVEDKKHKPPPPPPAPKPKPKSKSKGDKDDKDDRDKD